MDRRRPKFSVMLNNDFSSLPTKYHATEMQKNLFSHMKLHFPLLFNCQDAI